jgi:hypothetical protein
LANAEVRFADGLSGVVELGPDVARGEIDRGVLPDPPGRTRQPADVEAVEADELARAVDLDVALDRGGDRLRAGWAGIAGDERQPGQPSGQAVPAQDPPHAAGTDQDPAPALLGERRRDPPWAEPGMAKGEGDDPLLGQLTRLVGHPRRTPLTGSEHLQTRARDRPAPAVEGRVVDVHQATRGPDVAELCGQAEQPAGT